MNRMRIVVATPLYPPEPGGPATYTKLIEEEFSTRGVEVVVVKFQSVRKYPKILRHLAYFCAVLGKALSADKVYALDPVSTGLPAWCASVCAGKPFYVRIAGDYAWEQGTQRFGVTDILDDFVTKNTYGWQVSFFKALQVFVARRAKAVVVPSAYLKRMLTAWGLPVQAIHVVYNAPARFPDPRNLARPAHIPGPYITTVARLVPWKGVSALIEALGRVRETGVNLYLVVVGDGSEEQALRSHAETLNLAEYVLFMGRLSHGEAPAYVAHAGAFVLNTRYEGFSHVILEAFALRVPVITTPVGGNVEQVQDGETGLLVPYNDVEALTEAILRVRSDVALRTKLIGNAVDTLSTFTRERAVTGSLEALQV